MPSIAAQTGSVAHRQRSVEPTAPVDKTCVACGRRIQWRAKWARDWEAVRFCSDACRRRGVTDLDRRLEAAILALLAELPAGGTLPVSEVARALDSDRRQELAEPARRAARRLVAAGEVDILQHGRVVDPSTARGEFQVRRRPR
jgi:hypothetical protein